MESERVFLRGDSCFMSSDLLCPSFQLVQDIKEYHQSLYGCETSIFLSLDSEEWIVRLENGAGTTWEGDKSEGLEEFYRNILKEAA